MRVTRRGLLGIAAGATGATFLARGALSRADSAPQAAPKEVLRSERLVASICQQCAGGCGVLVRVVDEKVAGVSGNPLHPVNRGRLCPKAFGALQLLRSPRLLDGPRMRGGKGGSLRKASWDEALGAVVKRLGELRGQGLAHTVAVLGGQFRGSRDLLWRRFAQAYGTPNYIRFRCLAVDQQPAAQRFTNGAGPRWTYDLEHTRLVVSFGTGLFESWVNPVYMARTFAEMRGREGASRGRLIHVDPRRSLTATRADRWVPIKPGTDGILAMGLANVLVREGLYDKEFVDKHCFGFEPWQDADGTRHPGLKDLVLTEYGLFEVSQATGVPVDTIIEVGRDLGTTRPALVIGERGPGYGADDLHARMAIQSLNMLLGNYGAEGGLWAAGELPLTPLPEVAGDEVSRRSLAEPRLDGAGTGEYHFVTDAPQAVAGQMLAGKPYQVNAALLFATNPFVSHPTKEDLAKAFAKVPLVVSFSPYEDETTAMADVVLPDLLPLERWQDDYASHFAGFSCYSVGSPAVEAGRDARNAADSLLALAAGLGGPVASALPWGSFEDVIKALSSGLQSVRRGYVAAGATDESMRNTLERQGYWVPEHDSLDSFWEALVERGAWVDTSSLPIGRRAKYDTPSGKLEMYEAALARARSDVSRAQGADSALARRLEPMHARESTAALEAAKDYPLVLNTYRLVTRPTGGARDQAWLLEQPAVHVKAPWTTWIEIHPETAASLGIRDGQKVSVESAKGKVELVAKLYAGTRTDVVSMPIYSGIGANVNDLIASEPDAFRGFGLLATTRVRIRRA